MQSSKLFPTFFQLCRSSRRLICGTSLRPELAQPHTVVKSDPKYVSPVKFPEQTVRIETCGKLYEEWRKTKRFRKVPDGNLPFDVRYVDTLKDGSNETRIQENSCATVLLLHGSPGSFEDYSLLTSFLWERGIRVIAPCFPDYSMYPPGVFRFSVEEKTQFIKDFLQAINVPCVDLLVCHSSAVYPSLQLCVDNRKPRVSTLALLNPGAFSTKMIVLRLFPLLKRIVSLSETKSGLELLKVVGPHLLKYSSVPLRVDNYWNPLLSITTMVYANIPKAREHLHELSLEQFPIFLAFSEDDKMVQKELSYRIAYKLGVQDLDISYITSEGELSKQGRTVRNVQVMVFENGSHYVFSRYSKIVNEAIFSFLQKYVL